MSELLVELPDPLHEKLRPLAEGNGMSVEQWVVAAASEKAAAVEGMALLRQRAARGSATDLRRILAKVPDVPPETGDEIL